MSGSLVRGGDFQCERTLLDLEMLCESLKHLLTPLFYLGQLDKVRNFEV